MGEIIVRRPLFKPRIETENRIGIWYLKFKFLTIVWDVDMPDKISNGKIQRSISHFAGDSVHVTPSASTEGMKSNLKFL